MFERARWLTAAALAFVTFYCVGGTSAEATVLPETISKSQTLTKAGGPYTGGRVTIKQGATLTISAGSVLKLGDSLVVEGGLKANGTAAEPVVMTAKTDDVHGGDTNGDGSGSQPSPGGWLGVTFRETGSGYLRNSLVLYGGSAYSATAALRFECPCSNQVEVANSTISHSAGIGISVDRGSPKLTGNTISDSSETGLSIYSGSPIVAGNSITENARGINDVVGSQAHVTVAIDRNIIKKNKGYGIRVTAEAADQFIDSSSLGNNQITGNGARAVEYLAYSNSLENSAYATNPVPANISTNLLKENAQNGVWVSGSVTQSQTWSTSGYAFVIARNALTVARTATLTVAAGVTIKAEGSMTVLGSLRAEGTASKRIAFTAIQNDSTGGDTNGDGTATVPSPGDCGKLTLSNSAESVISYASFTYGGYAYFYSSPAVEIVGYGSTPPRFTNSTVSRSLTSGIELRETNAELIGNTLVENREWGITALSGSSKIYSNNVSRNGYGVRLQVLENTHARVEIDKNTVEQNVNDGIVVNAHSSNQFIDFASLGLNVVRSNGGRAIVYDAYGNMSGSEETATGPVPLDITTNVVSSNSKNGIWLSGTVTEDQKFSATPYALVLTGAFVIADGVTLSVEDGAVLKSESSVVINGNLVDSPASGGGLAPLPILTSVRDDSHAGDTNGDGAMSTPASGDWAGLYAFEGNGQTVHGFEIAYASTAVYVQFLSSMTVIGNYFVQNEKAVYTSRTLGTTPFPCVLPFDAYIDFGGNAFSPPVSVASLPPAPTVVPEGSLPFFKPWFALEQMADVGPGLPNSVQLSGFSCEPNGIKNAPVSPVKP